jgi:hypothetical protein
MLLRDEAEVRTVTLHVVYSHECSGCKAYYIPYDTEVPCPRCGLVEARRFDYIPQAAASMELNKEEGGSYTPPAWWIGSLGDHLLSLLFDLFDAYEAQRGQLAFEAFLDDALGRMK